jgi:hypothetical protein
MFAYVGGYTTPDRDGRGDGIHVFRIDAVSGRWQHIQHVGGLENPSLFTLTRDGTRLYSVHGGRTLVSAFADLAEPGRQRRQQPGRFGAGSDRTVPDRCQLRLWHRHRPAGGG